MKRTARITIYLLYFLLAFVLQQFIFWLFPFTGLGAILCLPLIIIVSFGFGFFLYKIARTSISKWKFVLLFTAVFSIQAFLQLLFTPQDFGGSTLYKIGDTIQAYKNYQQIKLSDLSNLTNAERVVYFYKFKNQLPDNFILLEISNTESKHHTRYIIENRNESRYYDTTRLKLIENDTVTFVIEYLSKKDSLVHKTPGDFLNSNSGISINSGFVLQTDIEFFKMETGIENLLFSILSYTKKSN